MFLSLALIVASMIIVYFGHNYKSAIVFLGGIFVSDLIYYVKKQFATRATFVPSQRCYFVKFYLDNVKYTLCIPENQAAQNGKILALSGSLNCTERVRKILGPNFDAFNFLVSPLNLGLEKLTIWRDKKRYVYSKNDPIKFEEQYVLGDEDDE